MCLFFVNDGCLVFKMWIFLNLAGGGFEFDPKTRPVSFEFLITEPQISFFQIVQTKKGCMDIP